MTTVAFVLPGPMAPGNQVDPYTEARLRKLLELPLQEIDYVLCTGGIYRPAQTRPAAEIMKKWLISAGIEPQKILTYPHSVDSFQDVEGLIEALTSLSFQCSCTSFRVIVISQKAHLRRIQFIISRYLPGNESSFEFIPAPGRLPLLIEWAKLTLTILDARGESWIVRWVRQRRQRWGVIAGKLLAEMEATKDSV